MQVNILLPIDPLFVYNRPPTLPNLSQLNPPLSAPARHVARPPLRSSSPDAGLAPRRNDRHVAAHRPRRSGHRRNVPRPQLRIAIPITDPWDWYLHEWLSFMVNVGKYTRHRIRPGPILADFSLFGKGWDHGFLS